MSGKLTLDTTAGGSVTLIADDTITTDEVFDITTGTFETMQYYEVTVSNVDWKVTKFFEGRMEIEAIKTTSDIALSSNGSIFYKSAQTFTYPEAFTSTPSVTPFTVPLSNELTWGFIDSVSENNCLVGMITVNTGDEGNIGIKATGRWK